MGGEIFAKSLRSLEAKSENKLKENISLETREKSLSNDMNIMKNETYLLYEKLSQRIRKREINKFKYLSDIFSHKIALEKRALALIALENISRIKMMNNGNIKTSTNPEIVTKPYTNTKKSIKDLKTNLIFQRNTLSLIEIHNRQIIKGVSCSKLNLSEKISTDKYLEKEIKLINLENISWKINKLPKLINWTILHVVLWYIASIVKYKTKLIFDPGILILYNLLIIDKMEKYNSGLNEWTKAFTNIIDFRNTKQKFDKLFHEEYCKAYYQEDRIHLINIIANEFFETNKQYSYLNALVEFYDSINASYNEYYFDNSQINLSGKAPLFIDYKTLVLKFILRRN